MLPFSPMIKKSKWGQSVTPVTSVNYVKPPSRKLWQKEDVKPDHRNDKRGRCRISDKEKWDVIQSPQFVDFSNLPTTSDSFFGRTTVIVSTPLPTIKDGKLPSLFEEESIITSLNNFRLSGIRREDKPLKTISAKFDDRHEQDKEQYVVHEVNGKLEKNDEEICHVAKKPQSTTVKPFTFHLREKHRQEQKQERINKLLEEEKKMRVFRANPVPKFLKSRSVPTIDNTNHNNNNNNEKTMSNVIEKAQKQEPVKKNIEIWRKPPFVPCSSKNNLVRPKTPPLHSIVRAQDRKRFDDAIKEKEKQREQMKQMEIAAMKKQEEEEIARLRKQTIHKAQPIRKYKLGLPTIQKRPLTDPISPISLKRRRLTPQHTI